MKNLLRLILKDKKVERYNVFASLEDINRMLMNQCFTLDRLAIRMTHVEGHMYYDSDTIAPPRSSARDLVVISSYESK